MSAPLHWDVFDPNRRLRGQVETPANFIVARVTADQVVGVWRDDAGVEHVRSYTILKR
ncbi:MAG: hypothetical protein ACREMA_03545 [Longimicrobiales bacterium]